MSKKIKSFINNNPSQISLTCIIIVFAMVVGFMNPRFFRLANLTNILSQSVGVGILSIGMTFVLISGGIDLSCGVACTLGAIALGVTYDATASPYMAILVSMFVSLAVGYFNGTLTTRLKLVPFVATLATQQFVTGFFNIVGANKRIYLGGEVFQMLGTLKVFGFDVAVVAMFVLYILGSLVLHNTKLGAYVYLLGSNEASGIAVGINTKFYRRVVYVIMGFCVGLASLALSVRVTMLSTSVGGSILMLNAITAVIIGGTNPKGGSGNLFGTFMGVLFVGVLSNMLSLLNVTSNAQDMYRGIVLILVLVLNIFIDKQSKQRLRKKAASTS